MYKRILVTLDGSPLSEQVLPQVKQLIAGAETSITLLTVAAAPEESAEARAWTILPPAMVPVGCQNVIRIWMGHAASQAYSWCKPPSTGRATIRPA